ncbi:unnamed protein product [Dibothriocephalus latus]|uniref:Uncharacterized protein n=1 Tax=Dibothriocephalus latus TaxID=60516 RepID=A0A3P7Q6D6_DIBLA|nr:unnamed protein product [Dibothriocephalus latus]
MECVSWIEKVDAALVSPERPQLEELCDLQLRGDSVAAAVAYTRNALTLGDNDSTSDLPAKPALYSESKSPVHSVLDAALSKTSARLLHVIGQARLLEEAVKKIIDAKPGSCSLSDAEALVMQTNQLKASFSLSKVLSDLCNQAHKVLTHFHSFEQLLQLSSENTTPLSGFPPDFVQQTKLGTVDSTPRAWLDFFEEVCEAANKLPFKFPPVDHLKQLVSGIRGLDLLIHRDAKLPRSGQPPYAQDDEHDVGAGRATSSSASDYLNPDDLGSTAYLAACADNANVSFAFLKAHTFRMSVDRFCVHRIALTLHLTTFSYKFVLDKNGRFFICCQP